MTWNAKTAQKALAAAMHGSYIPPIMLDMDSFLYDLLGKGTFGGKYWTNDLNYGDDFLQAVASFMNCTALQLRRDGVKLKPRELSKLVTYLMTKVQIDSQPDHTVERLLRIRGIIV